MTNEQTAVPLSIADLRPQGLATASLVSDDEPAPTTALESQRFGLLTAPPAILDKDRRMEEWIAGNLDLDNDDDAAAGPRSAWLRLIDGLPGLKRPPREKRREKVAETSLLGWPRFHVAYKRGITVVRLVDTVLVKEALIHELALDLHDLIEAGNHRIVLNFHVVERLASWVIVAIGEARRQCESADGGALKICGLPQQLASIFPIAGVELGTALHADEASAIDSPWPEPSGPRPLPIEILSAITRAADLPPISGGSSSEAAEAAGASAAQPRLATSQAQPAQPATTTFEVVLNIQVGGSKGRTIPVSGPRFLIGRDGSCQLRLGAATVSKFHAAIEHRPGRIVLLDLGSTNGTLVNGRVLRNKEVELMDGDRIQIGSIVATITVGTRQAEAQKVDELVAGWLNHEGCATGPYQDEAQPTEFFPASDEPVPEPERRVKCEVIQDVLVITPQVSELGDDEAIELLRGRLHALFHQPGPRHVVVNLECVRHLNAQAIGMLLAHHLRLERAGGALRLCQAHARLMAVLHHVRLTILVECHPTLDEAVLASWPGTTHNTSAES